MGYVAAYGECLFLRILALTSFDVRVNSRIMNTPKYHPRALKTFFKKHKIATIEQIRAALGDPARCTVFRKLGEIEYLSSYSHRGKYYTLKSIARFTGQGLWNCRAVWFSRFGNLLDTAEIFVRRSEAGYSAAELKEILCVKTKHALTQLVRRGRLQREKVDSIYIYLSPESSLARQQRKMRTVHSKQSSAALIVANPNLAVEEAKAIILLFSSMLNEQQRRLYAGLESLKLGHGGDAHIASLLGMDPHTVARGRRELISADLRRDAVRAAGGGRLSQEKKHLK